MTALQSSFVTGSIKNPQFSFSSGSALKSMEHMSCSSIIPSNSFLGKVKLTTSGRSLIIRASRDEGRPSSASVFVGGFVLGGIVMGALSCAYAPQISKALTGADRKDLMRKLPKFIYDEEKALERTRRILAEKIEQLNSAIDEVSSQLHGDDPPNGTAVNSDEIEASI
ncbi:uncharacterized protein LOC116212472 [Punica granatum]|uniref:Uncharacterized protein LOC116212472 n=1 Tax=Punica granatum TaxID=22663 RepID=A0A218W6S7_PUNGR|nr:uncharacterized protein LOC116212472 [Punica granatum]OWM68336.1 hypothetical protein CDL15_Pgr004818 [Punica granatum]